MTKKKNHIYPEELPDNITTQEMDVGKQMGLSKDVISKFIFWQGEQWWQARMPPTDKYPEYPDGRIYFTKNARDPKVLNFAVDQVNGKARGNLKWTDGEGGNPAGRPKGVSRISIKSVCDSMGVNPPELLVAIVSGDIGALRKFGIKNPKDITIAQKLSTARYLTDKLVPNLKPTEIGEDGDYKINLPESNTEEKQVIQLYLPEKGSKVDISLSEREAEQIRQLKNVEEVIDAEDVVLAKEIDSLEDFNDT
jgi:hypothetical protein